MCVLLFNSQKIFNGFVTFYNSIQKWVCTILSVWQWHSGSLATFQKWPNPSIKADYLTTSSIQSILNCSTHYPQNVHCLCKLYVVYSYLPLGLSLYLQQILITSAQIHTFIIPLLESFKQVARLFKHILLIFIFNFLKCSWYRVQEKFQFLVFSFLPFFLLFFLLNC